MPLSEEELRLLEQMERALTEEDPKFASTLRGTTLQRTARRHAVLAVLGFIVGIAVLMTGVISNHWQVGIVGFVVMLVAATVGLTAIRGQRISHAGGIPGPHPAALRQTRHGFGVVDGGRRGRLGHPRQHGFMDTLRVRWRRRRDSGGW